MPSISILLLTLLTLLVNLSSSTPSLPHRQAPRQFYLRTAIVPSEDVNDTGTFKGELYIQHYHTGAGLNDVTLTPNVSEALSGFLNSTDDLSAGQATWNTNISTPLANNVTFYWEMCAQYTAYANWGPMTISIADQGETICNIFYADGDLLMCAASEWLVCDWWHGRPQLFYVKPGNAGEVEFLAPTSCSVVDLQMVLLDEDGQDGGRMGMNGYLGE